jgi:hypothetical protein
MGGGENRTVDRISGKGQEKLSNEEFVDLYVGKDDEFIKCEIEGSVTDVGVERN